MGRTLTDFSQLSKGMFKKSDPVVEVKPLPESGNGKQGAGNGDEVLSYFGLTGYGKRGTARAGAAGVSGAPRDGADNGRIKSLEANVAALRARYGEQGTGNGERLAEIGVKKEIGGRNDKRLP